ncbi:MAG: RIO1 family regulatory kinase/ATPase [Candidatus Bathyarchaeia archaeon]|jgi:tRNA A-37 threonylcarbamoyl transferase component Bud32
MTNQLTQDLKQKILNQCTDIAANRQITAACLYGPWVCGYADNKTEVNVLLVLDRYPFRVNTYFETVDGFDVSVLTVNRADFEHDVNKAWLGEFFSEKLTMPYEPLLGAEYLWFKELKIKKRNIHEILENLIMEFPESSRELLIRDDYFMYEVIQRRVKLFPPIVYSYLNMLTGDKKTENIPKIMAGYQEALKLLVEDNTLTQTDGYTKITKTYITKTKKRRLRIPPFIKTIQRMALTPLLSVVSDSSNIFFQDQRLFAKNNQKRSVEGLVFLLENPRKHVFLPTPLGPVSLADRSNIVDIARKLIPDHQTSKVKISSIGGVFNDVYRLTLTNDDGTEQDYVLKQFKDWSNLKWLPLTLWSFGTTTFSVLGQSRLEKEYAINTYLHKKGFTVPEIFHISSKNRIIIEEYIEGHQLVPIIKRILYSSHTQKDLTTVNEVAKKIAQAHSLGVCLGDCKPENFIVTKNQIFIVDLEQATHNGNQTWDIAEFLYFSGHYSPPIGSANQAILVAKSFIEGYLDAGGKKETVRKAGSPRYTKVFSIFTPPQVLLAISGICLNMGKELESNQT